MGKQWTFEEIEAIGKRMAETSQVPIITSHQVTFVAAGNKEWREQSIRDLQEWLSSSNDYEKTIQTWQAVYLKCGRCVTEFNQYAKDNPVVDVQSWIAKTVKQIEKRRWT